MWPSSRRLHGPLRAWQALDGAPRAFIKRCHASALLVRDASIGRSPRSDRAHGLTVLGLDDGDRRDARGGSAPVAVVPMRRWDAVSLSRGPGGGGASRTRE